MVVPLNFASRFVMHLLLTSEIVNKDYRSSCENRTSSFEAQFYLEPVDCSVSSEPLSTSFLIYILIIVCKSHNNSVAGRNGSSHA